MGSITSAVGQRPQRMSLSNLHTAETMEMQYNPEELEEGLEVTYQRLTILGMSHQELQYINTGNHEVTLKLAFDSLASPAPKYDIIDARKFLLSLHYAPRGANTIRSGAPPRVLFFWPKLFAIQARILKPQFKHTRFALNGTPTAFVVTVQMSEVLDARLTSDDVRARGTLRGGLLDGVG